MFKSDLTRTVAAIACTIVFSATAIAAAIGPAHTATAVATAPRLSA